MNFSIFTFRTLDPGNICKITVICTFMYLAYLLRRLKSEVVHDKGQQRCFVQVDGGDPF